MEYEKHCKESSTTAKTALGLSIGALGIELLGANGGGILSGLLGKPQTATVTADMLPMIMAMIPMLNQRGYCCNDGVVSALEAEIAEIEDLLLYAIVINKKNIDTSVVSVGTKVALYDEEFDEVVSYTITGSSESDPKNGFISNESPVGKALIGHKVGDKVAVTTPGGEIFYTIKKISV